MLQLASMDITLYSVCTELFVSFLDINVITGQFIFDIAGKKWENIGVKSGR
jgi:hypothetical protein